MTVEPAGPEMALDAKVAKLLSIMGKETRLRLLIALCEEEQSANVLRDHVVLPVVRTSYYLLVSCCEHALLEGNDADRTVRYICVDENVLRVIDTWSKLAWR